MTADRCTPATWTPAQRTVMDATAAYGALGVVRTVLELYPELAESLGVTTHPLIRAEVDPAPMPLPDRGGGRLPRVLRWFR